MLLMIEALSNEKSVHPEIIFDAIEQALKYVTEKQSAQQMRVQVDIDRKTGEHSTQRIWQVVLDGADEVALLSEANDELVSKEDPKEGEEEFEPFNENYHIYLSDAKDKDSGVEVGDVVSQNIESIDFGRIAAQMAKKVIARRVREAEKKMVSEIFASKLGQIATGAIKRVDRGNVIVDLIQTEAVIPQENLIPREALRVGDRVRAIISEINNNNRNQLVILDRRTPKLIEELFKIEVPEINEDRIEIINIARDVSNKTKIAVRSTDPRVTAYGACIGLRGSRIQAIQNEISAERIDVIEYSDDIAEYISNALEPAKVESVVYDESSNSVDVSVNEENYALAIGKNGQNVRLASELVKVEINILTPEELQEKQEDEFESYQNMISESLGVDQNIAFLLVNNGYVNLQSIIQAEPDELLNIEEFDEQIVSQLQEIAREVALTQELTGEKLDDELVQIEGMDDLLAYKLLKSGVRTVDDLADFATDELVEISDLNERRAARLIMKAREHWFEKDQDEQDDEQENK